MTDSDRNDSVTGANLRGKADKAVKKGRDKADRAYSSTARRTRGFAKQAGEGLESNPMVALAGGAAIGVLAGILLPGTERETRYFGTLGKRMADGATAAAVAARDAGKEELNALAPDRDAALSKASNIFGNVVNAATDAGKEAATE